MSVIYVPKGKAREYSPLACNLYGGCSHGCLYCYAPSATFKPREVFYGKPHVRPLILEQIEKEAAKLPRSDDPVLLCFTTDPYQPLDAETGLTRKALEIFSHYNIPVQVLTKGGLLATRDFDILARDPRNRFSVTLTHDDAATSRMWEPGASLPADRIKSLEIAHSKNISTWVSFEPVFDPEAVYRLIEKTHKFVDLYKVGKLNYHKASKEIDWPLFRDTTETILSQLGKDYYIKDDLRTAA